MKLKYITSRISMFLAVLIILATVLAIPVSAVKVGDAIGNVLNTDIKVYINGSQIPGYAVNNKIAVIMEDLNNYGFTVTYDDRYRTLSAVRNYNKAFKPIQNIPDNKNKPGSVAFPYLYTDIKAFLYDNKITSFAIAGRIVIYIDDLSDFGSFTWDGTKRELRMQLYESDTAQTAIDPLAKGSAQQAEEIKKLVYKYSPTGTYILTNVSQFTAKPITDLISAWYVDDDDILGTLNTAVHEICHMYTGEVKEYEKIDFGIKYITDNYEFDENNNVIYNSKYIIDGSPIIVKYSDQKVKTEEATANLPQNLRSFRWDFYVSEGNVSSANIDGAYGLLDEFHAYYYGSVAAIDCHKYIGNYLDKYGYSEKLVQGYFVSTISDVLAFYEFKFWTLEYLALLQEKYPSEYAKIMNNENYKKVFIYIHDKYEKLAEDIIPKNNKIILDKLNEINIGGEEDEYNIWIGDFGMGKFTKDIKLMKKQMTEDKYQKIMDDFRK